MIIVRTRLLNFRILWYRIVTGFPRQAAAELTLLPKNERMNECTSPPKEAPCREASDMHSYVLSLYLR